MNDIENRWMPPSPHKEAVMEFLKRGRAHIEERGHNMPPLLVFEDGGLMELPLARFKDGNFSPAEGETATRQTKSYDVCGTIDELNKLLEEKPEVAQSDPSRLFELIDDACYMLSRMQRRREVYREFAENIAEISKKLNDIVGPDVKDAYAKADELKDFLKSNPEKVSENFQELHSMAEGIRDVANRMEKEALYAYRDLAIELNEVYERIRGSRNWKKKDE
jgi:hypothetical protein